MLLAWRFSSLRPQWRRKPTSRAKRLDAIDAALIGGAKHSIDFTSYSLTDALLGSSPFHAESSLRAEMSGESARTGSASSIATKTVFAPFARQD
jgi:hypothetical protein